MKHSSRFVAIISAFALCSSPVIAAPHLQNQFNAVCNSSFVKSEKLTAVCAGGSAPKALKNGKRFSESRSVGAEINTLIRNLSLLK